MGACSSKPDVEEQPTYYNPFDPNAQHTYRQTVYVETAAGGKTKRRKSDGKHEEPSMYQPIIAPPLGYNQPPPPIVPNGPIIPPPPPEHDPPRLYNPFTHVPPHLLHPHHHSRHSSQSHSYTPTHNPLPAPPRDIYAALDPSLPSLGKKAKKGHRSGRPIGRIENDRIIIDDSTSPEDTPASVVIPLASHVAQQFGQPWRHSNQQQPLSWGATQPQVILPDPTKPAWPPQSLSGFTPTDGADAPVLVRQSTLPPLKKKKKRGFLSFMHSHHDDDSDTDSSFDNSKKPKKKPPMKPGKPIIPPKLEGKVEKNPEEGPIIPPPPPETGAKTTPANGPAPPALGRKKTSGPPMYRFELKDHPGFSLLSPHTVHYDGKLYPTAAHLLEAHKFLQNSDHPEAAEIIRMNDNLPGMYAVGREFEDHRRPDWDYVFFNKLDDTIHTKMMQHSAIREQLMGTGDGAIVFAAEEPFWGDGDGQRMGANELGRSLTRVRDKLRRGIKPTVSVMPVPQ